MTASDTVGVHVDPAEAARTRAVLDYDVLGRPPAPDLQSLVELAAHVCAVPTAVINVFTTTHQHQVAAVGLEPGVAVRADSLCARTLVAPRPVVVRDASKDPRFADNPFVTGRLGSIRFYAASQLRTPAGVTVGTLCVFDETPHSLAPAQAHALDALAAQVVDVLELRRRSSLLRRAVRDRDEALRTAAGAQDELRRSNEALSAFAGQVSHDLRNPLAAVTACLETLGTIDGVAGSAEAARFVSLGQQAAAGMNELVERLLIYARVGGMLSREDVDLRPLAQAVVEGLAGQVDRAGAAVEIAGLPTVHADRVQLRAVLENLVTNAVKFRALERPAEIRIEAARSDGAWCIRVVDNGVGIPVPSRQDVFGAFRRLPGSSAVDGFGLGLATCRRIVAAHGGDIGVEASPDGGATVWFTVPDAPPTARRAT